MQLYTIRIDNASVIIADGEYSKLQFSIESDDWESMQLLSDLSDEYSRLPHGFFDFMNHGEPCNINEARKFVDFIVEKWKDRDIQVKYIGPDEDDLYAEEDESTLY